jgi:hypothetical protein
VEIDALRMPLQAAPLKVKSYAYHLEKLSGEACLNWNNRSESFSDTRLALKSHNAAIAASRNSPFFFI